MNEIMNEIILGVWKEDECLKKVKLKNCLKNKEDLTTVQKNW